ncbi:MAG TPA: hypothetical protein VHC72_19600 [Bryobacteraceae bacterium]|nr:hypothetical protein [Bryobacteraceae bacterium]
MYYQKIALGVAACALVSTLLDSTPLNAARHNWTAEAREPFQHTFSNDKTLDVDNIDGAIQVIGDNGSTIRVEGEKIIRALDQQALDRAKREVQLDVNEKDGVAQLYVNGPFRNNGRSSSDHGFHVHFDGQEYEVTYNFTVHVPRETALQLRTVNGEVKTGDTRGRFDIHDVNGSITMTGLAGSGTLRTVNGPTTVSFREIPRAACEFHTVNGPIDASFPPNLAADLRIKTLNGQAYTDFEAAAPPSAAATTSRSRNGRFVYKSDRHTDVRIGAGGPQLSFETVNGDIRIRKGVL